MTAQYEAATSIYEQVTFINSLISKACTILFPTVRLWYFALWLYSMGTAVPLTRRMKPFCRKHLCSSDFLTATVRVTSRHLKQWNLLPNNTLQHLGRLKELSEAPKCIVYNASEAHVESRKNVPCSPPLSISLRTQLLLFFFRIQEHLPLKDNWGGHTPWSWVPNQRWHLASWVWIFTSALTFQWLVPPSHQSICCVCHFSLWFVFLTTLKKNMEPPWKV